jgi:pilus assembly protein TadC
MRAIAAIGRLLPRQSVREIGRFFTEAGIALDEEFAAGIILILSILSLVISSGISFFFLKDALVAIAIGIFVMFAFLIAFYEILLLKIDERTAALESVLSDFLSLVAANMRAGMTLDKALLYSARPEFGALSKEIEESMKKVLAGGNLEKELQSLSKKFRSVHLERAISIILEGIKSGGEIASTLERISINLRDVQIMRKEIVASTTMYVIFIFATAAIIAPLLYVVLAKVFSLFEILWERQPTESLRTPLGAISPAAPGIKTEELHIFSLALIAITIATASVMVSIIQTGKKVNAVKYALPIAIVAIAVYFLSKFLLDFIFKPLTL